ncbi:hypothetical protein QJS04_geneDACA001781 [Acorus gramineus]|uniref:Uncharacterized protein n=1 Tax=Acorus gramineus TaxID=55184 RepID=A0AAV9BH25_ACOGR|nr:hypothetical protein QJS04_geneDACA001781 [Acorus gramineus]
MSRIHEEVRLRFMGEYGHGFMVCITIMEKYVSDSWGGMSPIHRGYVADSLVSMSQIHGGGVIGIIGGMSRIHV